VVQRLSPHHSTTWAARRDEAGDAEATTGPVDETPAAVEAVETAEDVQTAEDVETTAAPTAEQPA
jgi:hypothetical protein